MGATGPAAERTEPAAAIRVAGMRHAFEELETLDEVSFEAAPGEIVAIVGPSGCGKSTLLELIGGLTEPAAGRIVVGGEGTAQGRLANCTWMPQRDQLLPWKRAVDNAAIPLRIAGARKGESRERARAMLERLGLGSFEHAYPHELSGGMRQRVAVARTLLAGKPVLLLDEPFAALDAITRGDLQEWLLATLRRERRTTLLVTHDVEEALLLADRLLLLSPRPGTVIWEAESPPRDPGATRAEAISSPAFVAMRERALEALAAGRRS